MTLAALLLAASALAATPDRVAPLRPLVGRWAGRMNCTTGNYGATVGLEEQDGALFARYDAASDGATPLKAAGNVGVAPRPKAGEFVATSNGVAVKVTVAEKGQVLVFSPAPATGLGAMILFSGTARLDKKRANAIVRYTVKTPLGTDSCMGSMSRKPS